MYPSELHFWSFFTRLLTQGIVVSALMQFLLLFLFWTFFLCFSIEQLIAEENSYFKASLEIQALNLGSISVVEVEVKRWWFCQAILSLIQLFQSKLHLIGGGSKTKVEVEFYRFSIFLSYSFFWFFFLLKRRNKIIIEIKSAIGRMKIWLWPKRALKKFNLGDHTTKASSKRLKMKDSAPPWLLQPSPFLMIFTQRCG